VVTILPQNTKFIDFLL